MIPLIVRFCLVSLIIFGITLVIIVTIVHQEPLAYERLQGLAQCNRPCWAGIEPGRTGLSRVPSLVAVRHPGRRFGLMGGSDAYAVNEDGYWINIGGQRGVVASVQLTMPLELWRLIMLYGTPSCMEPLESATILYWVFDDSQVIANFMPGKNDWQSRTLVLQTVSSDPCHQRPERLPWRGWAGF